MRFSCAKILIIINIISILTSTDYISNFVCDKQHATGHLVVVVAAAVDDWHIEACVGLEVVGAFRSMARTLPMYMSVCVGGYIEDGGRSKSCLLCCELQTKFMKLSCQKIK